MTYAEALNTKANTEAFEIAVEVMSDLAAEGDKEACKVLNILLTRNEDFIIRATH